MKTIKVIIIAIMTLVLLTGCQKNDKKAGETDNVIEVPEQQYLSDEILQEAINEEISKALDVGNEHIIEEATNIINLIRDALSNLMDEDYFDADIKLGKAISKAELIDMSGRENARVTTEITVHVSNKVQDIKTAMEIQQRVDSLLDLGHVQKARSLMNNLAQEINITRESISIPKYMEILKNARIQIDNKNYEKAILTINDLLDRRLIEKRRIPISLIKAQRMLEEATRMLNNKDVEKDTIIIILNNASYQLKFAETLGYGLEDNEYDDLYTSIQDIKNGIYEDKLKKVRKIAEPLNNKLRDFKEKISENIIV
jgi:hypothetical protein